MESAAEGFASTPEQICRVRAVRGQLLADPHRPRYHIVSSEGLCDPFDPNGALFWKGRYHLMYIFQRGKDHCWGHISSRDLVHWRHHPPALIPGGDTGSFSGGAFIDLQGTPTISYWGLGGRGGVCLAVSHDDELDHWVKSPHNPVIAQTQEGLAIDADGSVYGAADPSAIWTRDGRYYLLTGNLLVLRRFGLEKKQPEHLGDTTYLFASDDLVHWQYLHPFYRSDRRWTQADEDNMCPDFFPLGDRHMLLFISHNRGCQYYIGRYENDHFYPETHGRMSWTDRSFFAPESLLDDKGRRIMWAWIFDGRTESVQKSYGWAGTLSLPRVLWLGDDNTLRMAPADELAALRYNPRTYTDLMVPADGELPLPDVCGDGLELKLAMFPDSQARQFGVRVRCSPDGREHTSLFYDAAEHRLTIDTRQSSVSDEVTKSVEAGPFTLEPDEPLKLRIFIDRSVVEVFANDRQAVVRHVYPARADSRGVTLFSCGGSTRIASLAAWDMAPANPW